MRHRGWNDPLHRRGQALGPSTAGDRSARVRCTLSKWPTETTASSGCPRGPMVVPLLASASQSSPPSPSNEEVIAVAAPGRRSASRRSRSRRQVHQRTWSRRCHVGGDLAQRVLELARRPAAGSSSHCPPLIVRQQHSLVSSDRRSSVHIKRSALPASSEIPSRLSKGRTWSYESFLFRRTSGA